MPSSSGVAAKRNKMHITLFALIDARFQRRCFKCLEAGWLDTALKPCTGIQTTTNVVSFDVDTGLLHETNKNYLKQTV
jgi:hypothetical protein